MKVMLAPLACLVIAIGACSGADDPSITEITVPAAPTVEPVDSDDPDYHHDTRTTTPAPLTTPAAASSSGSETASVSNTLPGSTTTPRAASKPTPDASAEPSKTLIYERNADPPNSELLRVVDVERCLNLRAEPYIEAEVLTCIPLGEYVKPFPSGDYLSTHIEVVGRNGIAWREIQYGVEQGWASTRYLEGPEPDEVRKLPPHVAPEEFPDDVALLVHSYRRGWINRTKGWSYVPFGQLDRIYKRGNDGVERETLVTLDDLIEAHPSVFDELPSRVEDMGISREEVL